ncbi:MAG: hypothetical protein C0506_07445 [Anaerolinea sp.]|nr:hypothetical protein [Anaerolinea sp.]
MRRLRPGRPRHQQQRWAAMPRRQGGGNRRLRGLRDAKARSALPALCQGPDNLRDCGREAGQFACQRNTSRPAALPRPGTNPLYGRSVFAAASAVGPLCYHAYVEHAPGHAHRSPRNALVLGLVLTLAFVAIEAITGYLAGSLALVSDAGHALTDSAGLLLALAAATLGRRSPDDRRTYGYARFEVLAVPVHVTLLLGIAAYIVWESIQRFGDPHEIQTLPVLVVGAAGLAVNLLVIRLLHSHAHDNPNARAARLEAASDALGSVLVIASTTFIALGGWMGVDALVGLAIAAFILPRAWALLRQAGEILLESAPPGLETTAIIAASRDVEGVLAVHDVRVWSIAPRFPALSAHVELADVTCTEHILTDLAALLRERFGIGHVTLQPETPALHEAIECCLSQDAGLMAPSAHRHGNAPVG